MTFTEENVFLPLKEEETMKITSFLTNATLAFFCLAVLQAEGERGGTCEGDAQSCDSAGSGHACLAIDGCSWRSRPYGLTLGDYVYECRSISRSCGTYDTEFRCENQPGCEWEPAPTPKPTPAPLTAPVGSSTTEVDQFAVSGAGGVGPLEQVLAVVPPLLALTLGSFFSFYT